MMRSDYTNYSGRNLLSEKVQICTRCIFDSTLHGISFDDNGVCNYCRMVESLGNQYGTGQEKGKIQFEKIVGEIEISGRGKKYDVAVGVSGGTDSSYMLYLTKEYGLRPLAVHYDNTFNSAIATENIRRITTALNVDLYTHVCDNKESEDIFRSFFLASVPEIDGATDIALAEVMFRAASKYDIKYVFEGHSFVAEGVAPMGKAYVDGGYIKALHKKFGRMPMVTFPNMTFTKFLYWSIYKGIRKIRPLWYLSYSKEQAKKVLRDKFDWEDYGGHHLENRMSAFHHAFYTPNKFGLDQRNNTLSALVRNGLMQREDAFREYSTAPFIENDLVEYVMKRFDMSEKEFVDVMKLPRKYYTDYPTYKKRFERLRPLFFMLAKANLVPMSFYLKYCFPAKAPA
ncbi:MAG: N-acetyl sugar amidotransferase [Magnetococcus sp. THC-1_WYH]